MSRGQTYVCSNELSEPKTAIVIYNGVEQLGNQLRYRQQIWHTAPVSLQLLLGHDKSCNMKESPLAPSRQETWKN